MARHGSNAHHPTTRRVSWPLIPLFGLTREGRKAHVYAFSMFTTIIYFISLQYYMVYYIQIIKSHHSRFSSHIKIG
jgi:hypothetical protein